MPAEDWQGVAGPVIIPGVAGGPEQGHTIFCHANPLQYSKQFVVVFKTINPIAGVEIASICAPVILGGRKPVVVDVTSNAAEILGAFVPMPTCPEIIAPLAGAAVTPAYAPRDILPLISTALFGVAVPIPALPAAIKRMRSVALVLITKSLGSDVPAKFVPGVVAALPVRFQALPAPPVDR